jgi:hypothetical protein|tara:strand:- start:1973 stop:2092 length:120 start_codon:yes stop_codon:yes gene_type:complete
MLIKNIIKATVILIALMALVGVVDSSVKQKMARNYEISH